MLARPTLVDCTHTQQLSTAGMQSAIADTGAPKSSSTAVIACSSILDDCWHRQAAGVVVSGVCINKASQPHFLSYLGKLTTSSHSQQPVCVCRTVSGDCWHRQSDGVVGHQPAQAHMSAKHPIYCFCHVMALSAEQPGMHFRGRQRGCLV